MRKVKFVTHELYHIHNRGVDRRNILADDFDAERFIQSMCEFNVLEPVGSIYENSFIDPRIKSKKQSKKLVNIIAYCVNPNHFHFILEQLVDGGISKFMKRLTGGYSWYFNNKYQRSGALFQGPFKAVMIDTNEYLLHLSAYVNLNFKIHQLGDQVAKLVRSSWGEYIKTSRTKMCKKDIVLDQFNSSKEYKDFALRSLPGMLERKERDKAVADLLFD